MWIKTLGRPHGIPVPAAVDRRKVSRRQVIAALNLLSITPCDSRMTGCVENVGATEARAIAVELKPCAAR